VELSAAIRATSNARPSLSIQSRLPRTTVTSTKISVPDLATPVNGVTLVCAKVQNAALIWLVQEFSVWRDVEEGFFYGRGILVEPLQQQVGVQHRQQHKRNAACASAGVARWKCPSCATPGMTPIASSRKNTLRALRRHRKNQTRFEW